MNESLLASAVAHWASAQMFRLRQSMNRPAPVDCEVAREIEADGEFGQAVVEVASKHPDAMVCAHALAALARSHFPGFEEVFCGFDSDERKVTVQEGSFIIPFPLFEVVRGIRAYQSVADRLN
jgi:hypothetical protein